LRTKISRASLSGFAFVIEEGTAMEQEKNKLPETAAAEAEQAAAAEAAGKREEAIRKVEHMLAKDRAANAQKELDRISHLGASRVRYTAGTE
jgi:thioredoxin-like negative regulator of GroEL